MIGYRFLLARYLLAMLCSALICKAAQTPAVTTEATQVSQLTALADDGGRTLISARLEGLVIWASPSSKRLALQDATGTAIFQTEFDPLTIKPGRKVTVSGLCIAENHELQFGSSLLVDNDGFHPVQSRTGSIFLSAGRYPITLGYFDGGYE